MANFVNLMDVIYPVGSIYLSTVAISPAASIGGTWTQIKNCFLAASGDTYAASGEYAGSNMISELTIPDHQHQVVAWNSTQQTYAPCAFWGTNAGGGDIWQLLSYGNVSGSSGWNLWTQGTWRIDNNGNLVQTQQPFISYHYSVNVWKRTA